MNTITCKAIVSISSWSHCPNDCHKSLSFCFNLFQSTSNWRDSFLCLPFTRIVHGRLVHIAASARQCLSCLRSITRYYINDRSKWFTCCLCNVHECDAVCDAFGTKAVDTTNQSVKVPAAPTLKLVLISGIITRLKRSRKHHLPWDSNCRCRKLLQNLSTLPTRHMTQTVVVPTRRTGEFHSFWLACGMMRCIESSGSRRLLKTECQN